MPTANDIEKKREKKLINARSIVNKMLELEEIVYEEDQNISITVIDK